MSEEYIDTYSAQELARFVTSQFKEMPLDESLLVKALESTPAPNPSNIYTESFAAAHHTERPFRTFYLRRVILNAGVKYVSKHEESTKHLLKRMVLANISYRGNHFDQWSSEDITEKLEEDKEIVRIINKAANVFPYSLLSRYEHTKLNADCGEIKVSTPVLTVFGADPSEVEKIHRFENSHEYLGRNMDMDFIIKMVEKFRVPPKDI